MAISRPLSEDVPLLESTRHPWFHLQFLQESPHLKAVVFKDHRIRSPFAAPSRFTRFVAGLLGDHQQNFGWHCSREGVFPLNSRNRLKLISDCKTTLTYKKAVCIRLLQLHRAVHFEKCLRWSYLNRPENRDKVLYSQHGCWDPQTLPFSLHCKDSVLFLFLVL